MKKSMKNLFYFRRVCISILLILSLLIGNITFSPQVKAKENTIPNIASVTDIKEYEENELLVIYKKNGLTAKQLPKSAEEQPLTKNCSFIEVDTKKELRKAISSLEKDENVAYIQPNYIYKSMYTDDKFSDLQWQYYGDVNINMEQAWEKGTGLNAEVIVGIIDVGIDYNQEDIKHALWVNDDEIPGDEMDNDKNGYIDDIYGWNFFDDNPNICDYTFSEVHEEYVEDHGTHVAGIISAKADNKVGIAGIASHNNVKIMSAKIMGDRKNGNGIVGATSDIILAIQYIEQNGATICNLSLGYEGRDVALYEVMKNSNLLFICAAGNGDATSNGIGWDIDKRPLYPAAFDLENIISVANVNSIGLVDTSSCYGVNSVDIAAPGVDIPSTGVNDATTGKARYLSLSGTSMSVPMVSAVAALVASYYGNQLSPLEIKEAILFGASTLEGLNNQIAENRMLNAKGALDYYENKIFIETKVKDVSTRSNNKRIIANIKRMDNKITKVAYSEGEQPIEYFNTEDAGIPLEYDGKQVSFKVKKTGTYTIYILCEDGIETTTKVEANVPVVETITLSTEKETLKRGESFQLDTTVNPSPSEMFVKIVYKTSNSDIVDVSSNGVVVAKKKGKAKIRVYAKDGNTIQKAVCTIKVTN